MAQHIDIKNIDDKRFGEIYKSILNHFRKGIRHIKGSLRFEELPVEYRENKDEWVFGTTYKIPYDKFIYKSNEAYFEIHYNFRTCRLNKIYLVA